MVFVTECGEGRGVQAIVRKELAVRRRRAVGDENIVMVIGGEWERQSGHPGRIVDLREDVVCREKPKDNVNCGFIRD